MSPSVCQIERIAGAGRSRAIGATASRSGGLVLPTAAGAFAAASVWTTTPAPMGVPANKRHDLNPAPRPEEAVPT